MLVEVPRTAARPEIPQITAEEASAAARAAVELFERWGLSDVMAREILGGLSRRTYSRWKSGDHGPINVDLATRLSLLMGIHKALRILYSNAEPRYAWVSKPNDAFGGRAPALIMAEGSIFSLVRIRSYLDAECGAW